MISNFNMNTLEGLMCRDTLNVGWDGRLYDCDFNQMLGMEMRNGQPFYITDFSLEQIKEWKIITGDHCFGCSAGAGSSCQGALR